MVNVNSLGRSVYVLSNILLGIKHKKGKGKHNPSFIVYLHDLQLMVHLSCHSIVNEW